jgi:hypothetical protein
VPLSNEDQPMSIESTARAAALSIKPDRLEMDRMAKRKKEQAPVAPWTQGVWLFAFSKASITPFGGLTICFFMLGLCVRGLILLFPR